MIFTPGTLTNGIFKLAFSIHRIFAVRTMAAATKDLPELPPELWTMIIDSVYWPNDFVTYLSLYLNLRPVCRIFRAAVEHIFITQLLPEFEGRIPYREFFTPYHLLPRLER